jgi:hypothetical protein
VALQLIKQTVCHSVVAWSFIMLQAFDDLPRLITCNWLNAGIEHGVAKILHSLPSPGNHYREHLT